MKLERIPLSQTNRPLDVFQNWASNGYLLLSPPYQRGDVWGPVRQRNLIRSILLGIPIPTIIVNDRFSARWGKEIAVIDGKQRITAVLKFLAGNLAVPGEWFGLDGEVSFLDLPLPEQRGIRFTPIGVGEGQLKSLEEEREVFELVNFGGVPQGQSDFPED